MLDDVDEFILCPRCGVNEIEAQGEIGIKLYDDNGTIAILEEGKVHWSGLSDAVCRSCGWQGKVGDAIIHQAPEGCLTVNQGIQL